MQNNTAGVLFYIKMAKKMGLIVKVHIMSKIVLFACLMAMVGGFLFLPLGLGDSYAQDPKKILSIEAYDMLNTVPDTYLIDVRSRAEYQFVGHPISAYLFPYMFMTKEFGKKGDKYIYGFDVKNRAFVKEISKVFKKTDNLLLICRDGIRSALAAKDLLSVGFTNIYDVEDGFEGPAFPSLKDSNKHKFYRQLAKRNKINGYDHRRHYGWQWWGLPWTYEINEKFVYPPDLEPENK
jgi:rhodanese-related sulfurtransferase